MFPVPAAEKFNTFNTFNTFSTFGILNGPSDDLRLLELLVPQPLARYSPAVRG
jgi:hypothetical protein